MVEGLASGGCCAIVFFFFLNNNNNNNNNIINIVIIIIIIIILYEKKDWELKKKARENKCQTSFQGGKNIENCFWEQFLKTPRKQFMKTQNWK